MYVPELELVARLDLEPGRIPELDEQTRSVLASLIVNETIELPASNRGNRLMYGRLEDDEFVQLFRPLVNVLQLDPRVDRPPLREHINRASKLGLVPSAGPIYNRMNLSEVQTGLGFRAKYRFLDWTIGDFVQAGQKLARMVGGRPSRDDVLAASKGVHKRVGEFPTIDNIVSRFGRLSVFHELIGYPSCKGWGEEDYFDWAAAFYRQNPGRELTARIIDGLSGSGRGPSKQPIIKHFGSVSKFKSLSMQEYKTVLSQEAMDREDRLEQAVDLARVDSELADLLIECESDQGRILQVAAQYRLAKRLVTNAAPSEIKDGARLRSPDMFVRWCVTNAPGVSAANVETLATALGYFDDLWPMYRFQNVDLRLPAAA